MADALHHATVAEEDVGAVVDDGEAFSVEFGGEHLFGERHADAVGDALTERARRRFHARRHVHFGVTRRLAVELTERFQILHREVVARQVQQSVLQHRTVTVRENEAVAADPLRVDGVVAEMAAPKRRSDVGHAHGHPGVTGLGLLHGIHRKRTDGVGHRLRGNGRGHIV